MISYKNIFFFLAVQNIPHLDEFSLTRKEEGQLKIIKIVKQVKNLGLC